MRVVEALHADRDAVDAGVAEAAEARRLDRAGVRFERDLGAGLERQARAHAGEQRVDRLGREQARRAAADEDADQPPPPDRRQQRLQVEQQLATYSFSGSAPARSCELKSQYGHLRTHQGMCT